MTEITFHFGAPDKLEYTSRLLRKAVATGARISVLVDKTDAQALNAMLWNLAPTDFLAHSGVDASASVQQKSPILVLAAQDIHASRETANAIHQRPILVNASGTMPTIAGLERVIEVVSQSKNDRLLARERWMEYIKLGHQILRHDVQSKPDAVAVLPSGD